MALKKESDLNQSKHNQQKIACLYCDEKISVLAKKCMHCGSFQTWKRHLGIWATTISLILGVAATYGLIEGPTKEFFKPDYSITGFKVSATSGFKMNLSNAEYTAILQNKGKRSVVITQVRAHFGIEEEILDYAFDRNVLLAGEVKYITLSLPDDFRLKRLEENKTANDKLHENCFIAINWKGADNNSADALILEETTKTQLSQKECTSDFRSFLQLL